MRLAVVIHVVGQILRVLGVLFLAPFAIIVVYGGRDMLGGFLVGSLVTSVAGQVMVCASRKPVEDLRRIEALAVVAGAWLLVALMAAGMPFFEAMCHSMTTLAAGGFSPHELSIMGYQSPAIEWIICLFMFLAGANFALQYRALLGRPGALLGDEEFRTYAGIVFAGAVVLGVALWSSGASDPLRTALFQTLSVLTTTGYASVDFDLWNGQAKVVLLVLMFIGGCAGAAAGGPKVLRHLLIGRYTLQELRRTLHPRGVLVFFLFYVLVFAVTAACVIGLGADIVTGVTASAATLGNIGPGLGGAPGELRRPAPAQQGIADRDDVDRPPGGCRRPCAPPLGGMASRALARTVSAPRGTARWRGAAVGSVSV